MTAHSVRRKFLPARPAPAPPAAALLSALFLFSAGFLFAAEPAAPDFATEVRPILSGHCFKCHGPDEATRKGGLRLDDREAALRPAKSGERALVPGDPDASGLVERIFTDDPDALMPPPAAKHPLTAEQKDVLKRWVAAGAEYKEHWAFIPPRKTDPPANGEAHPVDAFVKDALRRHGLEPRPGADRHTLIRRVSLDLTGLPPTPEEADAFAADPDPRAYENLVDRLLASPHYGERWARRWLDLARYADTNGYEKDRVRSIWPWRDWVIKALNDDLPFTEFTIRQLAGDLLPDATVEQKVATGFHRNTMLNEEGGTDPLEFRFAAIVDRVHVTATAWLGLTMACAQCHTHKYDPILHTDYYKFMAFLNNADEPVMSLPDPGIAARREELEKQALAIEATLAERFPVPGEFVWADAPVAAASARAEGGAILQVQPDNAVLAAGPAPDRDEYTVTLTPPATGEPLTHFRVEALTDASLPSTGPGRTPHGNFVLSEFTVTLKLPDGSLRPLAFTGASADFEQNGFPARHAIDGNPDTGWAIAGATPLNTNRRAVFRLKEPVTPPAGAVLEARLAQNYGSRHTLGKFRVQPGFEKPDPRPLEERRREHLEAKFQAWLKEESAKAVRWTTLKPRKAWSEIPVLRVLPDDSILSTSDITKSDTYTVETGTELKNITAVRLEALPDESLPMGGPGRVYYEGPEGDFYLSAFRLFRNGEPVKFSGAAQSYAAGGDTADKMLDDDLQSGWSINGGQGKRHVAVLKLAAPLEDAGDLKFELLCEKYYAAGLGRFRLSVTDDPAAGAASDHPPEVEELLLRKGGWTPEELAVLKDRFLRVAPELASARAEAERLRAAKPKFPTTLVLTERPPDNPRATRVHHRGEFLQPKEEVTADVPGFLPPLPPGVKRDRLALARWLVSRENPLTARVTVNRQWQAFFGQGLVRTLEDFGYQGETPSHPELLDWLAVWFMEDGWSLKRLHRLIVTSKTYKQDSGATPEILEKDPQNRLLSRGPRHRVEAEMIRDLTLSAAGLLSRKIGGPSVFPPQPPGVTTEGAYGALQWKVSEGEDRYRRGLYTFAKRTTPYAMFAGFDAPSGEACVARRDVSNTPLQMLTLLNDTVMLEAAQTLGRQAAERSRAALAGAGKTEADPSPENAAINAETPAREAETEALVWMFRRVLTRPPQPEEANMLQEFCRAQKARLKNGELNAAALAGAPEGASKEDPSLVDAAAFTATARALLSLDEAIVKH